MVFKHFHLIHNWQIALQSVHVASYTTGRTSRLFWKLYTKSSKMSSCPSNCTICRQSPGWNKTFSSFLPSWTVHVLINNQLKEWHHKIAQKNPHHAPPPPPPNIFEVIGPLQHEQSMMEGRKGMFYLTMHSTQLIYGINTASDIW